MIDFFKKYISKLSKFSKALLALIVLAPLLSTVLTTITGYNKGYNPGFSAYAGAVGLGLFSFIFYLFVLLAIEKIVISTKNFMSDDIAMHKVGKSIKSFFKKIPLDNVVKNIKDTGKKIKFPEPYKAGNTKPTSEMSREELAGEVHKARKRKIFATPNQWVGGIIGTVIFFIFMFITGAEWWPGVIIGWFLLFFLPGAVFIGGFLDDR